MLRTAQYFDANDGTRTQIIGLRHFGHKIVSVECMVITQSIPHQLVDTVRYTAEGYLAARERAGECAV